jgi:hypothetical protein
MRCRPWILCRRLWPLRRSRGHGGTGRMVDDRPDHRRRFLHRSTSEPHLGWGDGGRWWWLAREISLGHVPEEPAQDDGAHHAAESGKSDDQDGPVASDLLGSLVRRFTEHVELHHLSPPPPPSPPSSPGVGEGRGLLGVGVGGTFGSCLGGATGGPATGGSMTSITLCTLGTGGNSVRAAICGGVVLPSGRKSVISV